MQTPKSKKNLLEFGGNYKDSQIEKAIYQNHLATLIEKEIYPHYPKAKRNNWRLGKLHDEWNGFLGYLGINIKAPRDHLKTFFLSEMYALSRAKFEPGTTIRIFSGTDPLAIDILDHIKKKWARVPYFKDLLVGADLDNKKQVRFSNGSEIFVQGFWSKIRGGHSDIIILDDIIDSQVVYSDEANKKAKERLAAEILPMAEPDTQIIIIGTLQREDDIYSIDWEGIEGERNWISRTYDAIVDEEKHITLYPEKWSWDQLMAKKMQITKLSGEKWFLKEYRNMAVSLVGEIIDVKWKRTYKTLPEDLTIYSGWDLSVGKDPDAGDYTAKITFGINKNQDIYIISVLRKRLDFGKRIKAVLNAGELEKPTRIAIEDNVFQADTVQVAKKNSLLPIIGVKTTINKVQKFNEQLVPLFENGKVFLKEGDKMQEEFWKELCSLPRGAYDDMCDAFCVGLKDLLKMVIPTIDWF